MGRPKKETPLPAEPDAGQLAADEQAKVQKALDDAEAAAQAAETAAEA